MSRKQCSIPRENLEHARVLAVQEWKRGARVCDVADMLGIHPNSVSRWIGQYRAYGTSGLRSSVSTGRPRKYDCKKIFPQIKKLVSKDATHFGFDTPLWTTSRLLKIITQNLKLKISRQTLQRLLREAGLSCQKPERRAYKQDPVRREKWLNETWPEIQKQAKKQRAVILFQDECSVSLIPTSGKTWARIGRTPTIKASAKKGSIPVISAISKSGKLYFTLPNKRVTSVVFVNFLKKILKQIPRKKIMIVLDNCSSHKSKFTSVFIEQNARLKLHFLPPYSPDFNPDELVWAKLKSRDMAGHQARTIKELHVKTLSKMRCLQKKTSVLKKIANRQI